MKNFLSRKMEYFINFLANIYLFIFNKLTSPDFLSLLGRSVQVISKTTKFSYSLLINAQLTIIYIKTKLY